MYSFRCMVSMPISIYSNCPVPFSSWDGALKRSAIIYSETCMIWGFFCFAFFHLFLFCLVFFWFALLAREGKQSESFLLSVAVKRSQGQASSALFSEFGAVSWISCSRPSWIESVGTFCAHPCLAGSDGVGFSGTNFGSGGWLHTDFFFYLDQTAPAKASLWLIKSALARTLHPHPHLHRHAHCPESPLRTSCADKHQLQEDPYPPPHPPPPNKKNKTTAHIHTHTHTLLCFLSWGREWKITDGWWWCLILVTQVN